LIGAEFLQQPVQQEGAAKPIDPHKTVLEDSGFNRGAIAGGADLGLTQGTGKTGIRGP
jgi:hypothetical protein